MSAARGNSVLRRYIVPSSNLFLMTRFAQTEHHEKISNAVKQAVRAFGLEFIRADDPNLSGAHLWEQVEFCMQACEYGVAIFETIHTPEFNPNVSLELGYMLGLNRQCLLLKEKSLATLPADLAGHLYKEFDAANIDASILGQVANWLLQVGVRRRMDERVIIFVSGGGTCRCAMSKAITNHLLKKRVNEFRVESRAAFAPSRSAATNAAIQTVSHTLGKNFLNDHRPRRMGVGFLYEADLILATDRRVLAEVRNVYQQYPVGPDATKEAESEIKTKIKSEIDRKLFLLTEFFEGSGDIADPWPDDGDQESLLRYQKCMARLYELISTKFDKLTETRPRAPSISFGTASLSG
jgi:protein-tyrosine-phosphatase